MIQAETLNQEQFKNSMFSNNITASAAVQGPHQPESYNQCTKKLIRHKCDNKYNLIHFQSWPAQDECPYPSGKDKTKAAPFL